MQNPSAAATYGQYSASVMAKKAPRVLLIGLGDLGCRIAQLLAEQQALGELRLAGRSAAAIQWAQLLSLGTSCPVSAVRVDARDPEALSSVLADFEPDLIVQCASLLSPWVFWECGTPPALQLLAGGFALQVSAQLPIITAVMQLCRKLGLGCPVVNCSYPDLTHPILACSSAAPTTGVGNAGMIALRIAQLLQVEAAKPIQVIAHHSQVSAVMTGEMPDVWTPRPWIFVNGQKVSNDVALYSKPGLRTERSLNYLSAVTAIPVIAALLNPELDVKASLPGVFGLPGGYPVIIRQRTVTWDLPGGISIDQAIAFNELAARADGVERIGADGTVFYTEAARHQMAALCPELSEPLHPSDARTRFEILAAFLQECQTRVLQRSV
jgi:hypothetical protein